MRLKVTVFLIALIAIALPASAQPVVLDFDDLPSPLGEIADGYGGMAEWGAGSEDFFYWLDVSDDPFFPPRSGANVALPFDADDGGVSVLFGTDYIWEGAWFRNDGFPFEDVWAELYDEGVLVHETDHMTFGPDYVWVDAGYDGLIDEVRIFADTVVGAYVMDDFTYTIPEPSVAVLLALGGLIAFSRRRRCR